MADESRKGKKPPPPPPSPLPKRESHNRSSGKLELPSKTDHPIETSLERGTSRIESEEPQPVRGKRARGWGVLTAVLALGGVAIVLLAYVVVDRLARSTDRGQPIGPVKSQDVDIACEFAFEDLSSEQLEVVKATIQSFSKGGRVQQEGGPGLFSSQDHVKYSFTVEGGLLRVAELDSAISYKVSNGQATNLLYDQLDSRFTTRYRTARLSGTVETIVRFQVAEGAKLYYSLEPGTEIPVPDNQIVSGNVELMVRLPRTEQYVYARTVLGRVEKFLRIDVSTGEAEAIDSRAYRERERSDAPDESAQE